MSENQETLIAQRAREMQEAFDNLPALEGLYFHMGADIGFISDEFISDLKAARPVKQAIKRESRSIAEFDREFEMTDEYHAIKKCRYWIKALQMMMSATKVRIEAMRSEAKGGV